MTSDKYEVSVAEQAACEKAYDKRYTGGGRGSGFIMYRYGFVDGFRDAPASAPTAVVAVPEGWQLVPKVITHAMERAASDSKGRSTGHEMESPSLLWRDMLSAAPQPAAAPSGDAGLRTAAEIVLSRYDQFKGDLEDAPEFAILRAAINATKEGGG